MHRQLLSVHGHDYPNILNNNNSTLNHYERGLLHGLQMYQVPAKDIVCEETVATSCDNGRVRLVGTGSTRVPARSIRVLERSVKPSAGTPYRALVERMEANVADLPRGVTLGASLVTVGQSGRVPLQIANFSDEDIVIQPRTPVE